MGVGFPLIELVVEIQLKQADSIVTIKNGARMECETHPIAAR